MPRNQGTSRKGKPGKMDRAAGMGKALQKAQGQRYRPRPNGRRQEGGMAMQPGVTSIGVAPVDGAIADNTRSVLELQDLDDFLIQADMANREFVSEKEGVVLMDPTGQAVRSPAVRWEDQKTDFVFTELSVPRRPAWNETTTPEELQVSEQTSFLDWRRSIAAQEEKLLASSTAATVTPFEKNLEVWRQLWRVMERSACLLQLVDARNPLFYLSADLREYAASLGKPMMVLINKSDFLSPAQRAYWRSYLTDRGWEPIFFSAVQEQQKLDAAAQKLRREERQLDTRPDSIGDEIYEDDDSEEEVDERESEDGVGVDVPLTRDQLLKAMMAFAKKHDCQPEPRYDNRTLFGMVGFPNVGKSSVVNVLMGNSKHTHGLVRVAVASQPGKTKHFQTLFLPDNDEIMLCDCPGLVFPSFVSNTADLIAAGVYPIAQMRDHVPVMNLICQRIPREIINAHYGIQLPIPSEHELVERGLTSLPNPTSQEFLDTYCVARGLLASASGVPDHARASRMIIKDYATGKLLYCHAPPTTEDTVAFHRETIGTALHNTRKLRERLLRQQKLAAVRADEDDQDGEVAAAEGEDLIDEDILELIGGASSSKQVPDAVGKKARKHGKKNRKNRNKDPYGCHQDPDAMISDSAVTKGVAVKAGKYSNGGYTRPTNYGNARGAALVSNH